MSLSSWVRISMLAALLGVTGCNIFNPSGEGDTGGANPRAEGEEFYRRGQYEKAMAAFERAISQDSTNSMAYYGYAKAAVRLHRLDNIGILNDLDSTKNDTTGKVFFLKLDNQPLMTRRLQAAEKVRRVLEVLRDRDTLTRWYNYTKLDTNSREARNDTLFAARKAYMLDTYIISSQTNLPGFRKLSKFPLTDRRMPFENLTLDLGAFTTLHAITRFYDVDQNGTIDFNTRDSSSLKIDLSSGGSFENIAALAEDVEENEELAQDMNSVITNLSNDLSAASSLISQLIPTSSSDSGGSQGASQQAQANIDSLITSMGATLTFYLMGDKVDNDGDGCVDEEIQDGKDNDFDGFVDEDSRVFAPNKPDGADNDRDGRKDPVNYEIVPPFSLYPWGNDTLGREAIVDTTLEPRKLLGYVYEYLSANGQLADALAATDWVKIKKDAPTADMNKRFSARDTLAPQVYFDGTTNTWRVPPAYNGKLDDARNSIGGCWRFIKKENE